MGNYKEWAWTAKSESKITRMYKNARWILWLHYFMAALIAGVILSIVYWCAACEREISDLRIELKEMKATYLDTKDFVDGIKKEREAIFRLPLMYGN